MTRENKFRLVLLAVIEFVLIGGGIALVLIGHAAAGILLLVVGTAVTTSLMIMLVVKGQRSAAKDRDEGG